MVIDSTFLVIVGVALGFAALIIATIENWDRLLPGLARWEWLIVGSLATACAWSAFDNRVQDDRVHALLNGGLAAMFMWQAISAFRRRYAAASVSGNS